MRGTIEHKCFFLLEVLLRTLRLCYKSILSALLRMFYAKRNAFTQVGIRPACLLLLSLCMAPRLMAQQDPLYSQYMFNVQVVNPAYVGSWNTLGFTALNRSQWVGLEGAPQTNTFSLQTPTRGDHVGLGISVLNDNVLNTNRLAVFGDYSYAIILNKRRNTRLRLGIKAGFTNYFNDLVAYRIVDEGDPLFQGVIDRKFMPNFGLGFFLHEDLYYLGMSIPKILENEAESSVQTDYKMNAEMRHWLLMGGYVFTLSDDLKFKPSFMAKAVRGAPFQVDLNANFLLKECFWFGGIYRTGEGFGFNVQWIFKNSLRIGYAADYTFEGVHGRTNTAGDHEIMISYELDFLKTLFRSSRYF